MNNRVLLIGGAIALLVLILYLRQQQAGASGGAAVYSIAGGDQAAANQAASTIEVARLNAAQGIFSTLAQGFSATQVTGLQEAGATARTQIQSNYATNAAELAYQTAQAGYNAQVQIAAGNNSTSSKNNFVDNIGNIGSALVDTIGGFAKIFGL